MTRSIRSCAASLFVTVLFISCTQALAADAKLKTCKFSDAAFNPTTDVKALDEYRDAVAQLLKDQQFADLDCIASAARSGKTRFPGGGWKLRNIYIGVSEPRPGHPTQEDWDQHMQLAQQWVDQNPQSITSRIALAESYVNYAWDARGEGTADDVSKSGWKLFGERLAKAKSILDENSSFATEDPDWYVAMLLIAQGMSWELPQETPFLQKAVAVEPGYQYYARIHANILLPRWQGEDGDASRFAEDAANKLGGDAGDILYFQIADSIICGCQDPEFTHFSWPRLQKGFAALETKYGVSLVNVNSFALMAVKNSDWVAANTAFQRIGDNSDLDKWRTLDWFNSNRQIATQMAPMLERARAYRKDAEANMKTPEGQAYETKLLPKLAAFEQPCVAEANGDSAKFELLIQIAKDGGAGEAHTEKQPGAFAMCLMKAIYASYLKKETPFPVPPSADYKMILEIDPTTLNASVK